jgi:hypothetical protein
VSCGALKGDRVSPGNAGVRVQDRDKVSAIARGVNMFVVPEELDDVHLATALNPAWSVSLHQVFRSYADHDVAHVALAQNV